MAITGYCMKCGKANKDNGRNKELKETKMTMTARGGFMAKGKCPDCGTTVCAIMGKEKAEKAVADGEAEKAY